MKLYIPLFISLALLACSNGGNDNNANDNSSSSGIYATYSYEDLRDGGFYKIVHIYEYESDWFWWLAENLNYNAASGKCYDDDPANCDKYGRLYDWKTAMKACLNGWRLPTGEEWRKLAGFAGGSLPAGKTLKAKTGWGWEGNGGGTDDFEFAALPAGYGNAVGAFGGMGETAAFWSSEESGDSAIAYIISINSDYLMRAGRDKNDMLSVRCFDGMAGF